MTIGQIGKADLHKNSDLVITELTKQIIKNLDTTCAATFYDICIFINLANIYCNYLIFFNCIFRNVANGEDDWTVGIHNLTLSRFKLKDGLQSC